MELIDRQAAIDALEEPCKVSDTWTDEYAVGERMQWEKDVRTLNSLPTIDAVPVIRCKDCMFFSDTTAFTGKCDLGSEYIFTNDYCSYAVWRNDDKRAKD